MAPRRAVCLAALALAMAAGAILRAEESASTVLDGVYTEAQARRGLNEYSRSCARCHGPDLEGGGLAPTLRFTTFLDVWREDYLSSLYQHIQTRMPMAPEGFPGSLREDQYVDIVAYILSRNQFPAGPDELTRAAMDTTLLVGPNGPQPLPPNAMVRAVGCLEREADDWRLSQAASPWRVRDGTGTDERELERSVGASLGELEFRLTNLGEEHPEPALRAALEQKVQVKGVMNGQGANARIYVLSFHPLGQVCAP